MLVGRLGLGALALVAAWLASAANAGAAGWAIEPVPPPTRPEPLVTTIAGVSCPTPRVCFAAGTGTREEGILERWNGRRWKRQRAAFGEAGPQAVSCSSPRACTVVTNLPFALRWNGSRWRKQRMAGASAGLNLESRDVSCPARRVCFAVALDDEGEDATSPVIERWNGRRWSMMKIRLRARASDSFLNTLSCATATACVALGVDG